MKRTLLKICISLLVVVGAAVAANAQDCRRLTPNELEPLFNEAGARYQVDPRLLRAISWIESKYYPCVVSPKGARGLMQLMPGTAARFGITNSFNPQQNIEGGARYLQYLLKLFNGNVELVMAGYNAGEGAVMKYGYRVPPYAETQDYVRKGRALLASSIPMQTGYNMPAAYTRASRPAPVLNNQSEQTKEVTEAEEAVETTSYYRMPAPSNVPKGTSEKRVGTESFVRQVTPQ